MYTTEIGDKKAKVFIQQQDLDTLATRKFKRVHDKKDKDKKDGKIDAEDV